MNIGLYQQSMKMAAIIMINACMLPCLFNYINLAVNFSLVYSCRVVVVVVVGVTMVVTHLAI